MSYLVRALRGFTSLQWFRDTAVVVPKNDDLVTSGLEPRYCRTGLVAEYLLCNAYRFVQYSSFSLAEFSFSGFEL